MKRRTLLLTLAGAALFLGNATALAQDGTPEASEDAPGLSAYVWELTEIEVAPGESVTVDDSNRYRIQFLDDGRVVIKADCNQALGTYTVDGETIDIEIGPMTLALCPEDSHSDRFVFNLGQAGSITMNENDEITLTPADDASEGAGSLVLRPSLHGVVWSWTVFLSMDESTITPDDPSRYTIEFLDGGDVAIGADCNRGRGTYSRNGAEIDIEITVLTRALCPEGSLSNDFIDFLNQSVTLTFRDGQLHLALPMDSGILSFSPLAYEPESEE